MPDRETKLARQARRFRTGEIDKWAFYETTRWYPIAEVAAAAEVPEHIVTTRRRDLRKMRKERNGC